MADGRCRRLATERRAESFQTSSREQLVKSIEEVQERLRQADYVADRGLATAIFLSLRLQKPLFLEGEAGVGKTEVAKVLSKVLDRDLIRLQCYEGLDIGTAVYEWNYARQILQIRLQETGAGDEAVALDDIFSRDFLLRRPLLEAIDKSRIGAAPVLLIDELDRADEEFEAYLLEVLSDYQISIPELGTIRAEEPPIVIVTSNRTREIHDALKRRCLYKWIDYPSFEKEIEIVRRRVPDAAERLAREVVGFVQAIREEDLFKRPGIAETLDWLNALIALDSETLSDEIVGDTLGVLLKYQEDIALIKDLSVQSLLARGEALTKSLIRPG